MRIAGIPVYWNGINGPGAKVWFTAGHTIDADGAPNCYHPDGSPPGLDYLENAGHPGNWWALATDNGEADGEPVIQKSTDPAPGFYVSMTAYTNAGFHYHDPRRYLNSSIIPFCVIPPKLRNAIKPKFLGCQMEAINMQTGDLSLGMCGDIGPDGALGEGSRANARNLRLNPDPKKGGTKNRIIRFTLYPGTPAEIGGKVYPLI